MKHVQKHFKCYGFWIAFLQWEWCSNSYHGNIYIMITQITIKEYMKGIVDIMKRNAPVQRN